jgi:hypothetical protein
MEFVSETESFAGENRRIAGFSPEPEVTKPNWMSLGHVFTRDTFSLEEKIAGFLAVVMMLAPLAAAAWGAHFGA